MAEREPYVYTIQGAYWDIFNEPSPDAFCEMGHVLWMIFQSGKVHSLPPATKRDLLEIALEGPDLKYRNPQQRQFVYAAAAEAWPGGYPSPTQA